MVGSLLSTVVDSILIAMSKKKEEKGSSIILTL